MGAFGRTASTRCAASRTALKEVHDGHTPRRLQPAEQLYTRTRREHGALLTPRLGEPLERDSLTTPWWREVLAHRS